MRRILFLQGYCEELDDAVQEVFVKVYRAQLPREEVFPAWFYRVILNTGRDMGRRQKTRTALAERLRSVATTDTVHDPEPADPVLRDAVAALPPDAREAVALRFFADLSLEQIAAAQDVPLGTVKSRLHGALRKLRGHLQSAGAGPPTTR